jgi:hypothetical protein
MLFPTSGSIYILETLKEAYNSEFLVPAVKHREILTWFGQQYCGTVFFIHLFSIP